MLRYLKTLFRGENKKKFDNRGENIFDESIDDWSEKEMNDLLKQAFGDSYNYFTGTRQERWSQLGTPEGDAIEKRVRQAVRLLLKEGHKFNPKELAESNEVLFALENTSVPTRHIIRMVTPKIYSCALVWEEYALKRLWTTHDAACLIVGMDPFMHNFDPTGYNNVWRIKLDKVFSKINDAIILRDLPAIESKERYFLEPILLCTWAFEKNLLTDHLTKPLQELAETHIMGREVMTADLALIRFQIYAEQCFHNKKNYSAIEKLELLQTCAIYIKFENPKLLREKIVRRISNTLSDECKKLRGFGFTSIKQDLYNLDTKLDHSKEGNNRFLNNLPHDVELMSTDPTHHWWSKWRPIIAWHLPWLKLPE